MSLHKFSALFISLGFVMPKEAVISGGLGVWACATWLETLWIKWVLLGVGWVEWLVL